MIKIPVGIQNGPLSRVFEQKEAVHALDGDNNPMCRVADDGRLVEIPQLGWADIPDLARCSRCAGLLQGY